MTMEFGKAMDISNFDWDDSQLIAAFDRTVQADDDTIQSLIEEKAAKKKHSRREGREKSWKIGDYCQAIFAEDGLYYEATIVGMYDDTFIVEFIGYGDRVEVPADSLEVSLGKKARQKQRKHVKKSINVSIASDTDYSFASETKDVSKVAKATPHHHHSMAEQSMHNECATNQYYEPMPQHASSHPAPHQHACNHASYPPVPAAPCQGMVPSAGFFPPPPLPSMPINPAIAKDPSLSPMLVSWYMAGYYTGLHQSPKSSCCSAPPPLPPCCHYMPTHCGGFH